MSKVIEPSNVLSVSQVVEPGVGKDLLTEILRKGARELLAQAVEQEVQEWLSERSGLLDERGRNLVVRNGHLPERTILTGIGPVAVRQPRVHDRRPDDEREFFSSKILPPYLRKTKSLEELIPWLSLNRANARAHSSKAGLSNSSLIISLTIEIRSLGSRQPSAPLANTPNHPKPFKIVEDVPRLALPDAKPL